jgi:aminopeptidase N
MRHTYFIPILFSAFFTSDVLAQPNPFGCHFFHGQPQIHSGADGDRSDINETIARSDTFDIKHYDIQLDVTNVSEQEIRGITTITYNALMAGQQQIRFDLLDLVVDSVTDASGQLQFTQDAEFVTIQLNEEPPIGEDRFLTVYYGGEPYRDPQWGGFYFQQSYIYNLGIGISTIPPNFGKVWYPCFDSFVERATYTYHVKSAGTYRFHGQGTFIEEVELGGDTVIRSYSFPQPIPTHLSAIAVANYQTHEYTHPAINGEIPVTIKAKPNHLTTIVNLFGQLPDAIDVCEHWYGAYPFDRVGYVLTVDGALEIPTNVAYPDHMTQQTEASNRALYTHELGHHWWGDMVTPYIHNDMWLKEGPAEYSGHLIEEWIDGQAGLVKAVKDNLLYVLRQAHINDDGFQALSPMPDPHIYGSHTYYKGALVMHNLRGYLGDTLFRQAMHGIQENLAYTTITAEGFKEALELYSGQDLDPFFDAWVYSPSYSAFEVREHTAVQSGSEWNIQLQIGQKLRGGDQLHYDVPIDLTLIAADGTTDDRIITVGGDLTTIDLTAPFEPAMIILNRHTRLNQARLDHEQQITAGTTLDLNLPYVEFRLMCEEAPQDALVRVDHMWVAPDAAPLSADVLEISDTHYWSVDGLIPEGTVLTARLAYNGSNDTQLDHALVDGDEFGMCILYRETPLDQWEVYPYQSVNHGVLINGYGSVNLSELRKGQYALGKTTGFVAVSDLLEAEEWTMEVYPVPATDRITVKGVVPEAVQLVFDILSTDGRIMHRSALAANGTYNSVLDVARLAEGAYLLRTTTTDGRSLSTKRFEVVR